MKKGQSYNCFTDKEKPNHPLVKAFRKRGIVNIEFIYASHWASDSGWTVQTIISSPKMLDTTWWGFTISSAVKNIEKAEFKKYIGDVEYLTM